MDSQIQHFTEKNKTLAFISKIFNLFINPALQFVEKKSKYIVFFVVLTSYSDILNWIKIQVRMSLAPPASAIQPTVCTRRPNQSTAGLPDDIFSYQHSRFG
jgi:hypothetical protein